MSTDLYEASEYAGEVGEYVGEVGEYVGEASEYFGEAGDEVGADAMRSWSTVRSSVSGLTGRRGERDTRHESVPWSVGVVSKMSSIEKGNHSSSEASGPGGAQSGTCLGSLLRFAMKKRPSGPRGRTVLVGSSKHRVLARTPR